MPIRQYKLNEYFPAENATSDLGVRHFICDVIAEMPTAFLNAGDELYCKENGKTYRAINSTTWVEMGGGGVSFDSIENEIPTGVINGLNTTFTLNNPPISNSLKLYLNGLRLSNTDDFVITSNVITMITIPFTGDKLLADYKY